MPHHVPARSAAALAAVLLVLSASQVSAALISHISWDVTGGTFDGINSIATGPITGGSLDFTPPGGSITTSYSGAYGGTWALLLTGPSGFFKMSLVPGTGYFYINPATMYGYFSGSPIAFSGTNATTLFATLGTNGPYGYMYYDGGSYKYGYFSGFSGVGNKLFTHYFTLGNEVRSPVPEPGQSLMLGAGFVLLAGLRWLHSRARRTIRV